MSLFCKKLVYSATAIMLMLLVVTNVYGDVPAVNSSVQSSSSFSSYGTIYIPEEPVSPPPVSPPPVSPPPETPPPVSPPPSGETIDSNYLTGLGDDYTIYYSDGPASVWDQQWIKDRFAKYHVKAVKLGFIFSDAPQAGNSGVGSIYDEAKMKEVLGYLDEEGVKGILLLINNGVSCKNYVGSWAWYNNWINVANAFKDDNRVAAFSIFCEPAHDDYYDTWATDGPLGAITDRRKLQQVFAYMIDAIHAIDPDREIIYPMGQFSYTNANDWYNDLQSLGITDKQHVVFDIVHPYYFENDWDMGMSPTQKVQWYVNNWIAPAVSKFGSDRCWSGETFAWSLTHDLQVQFLTQMINTFVDYDVGFIVWAYFSSPNQSWQNEAIEASNYY